MYILSKRKDIIQLNMIRVEKKIGHDKFKENQIIMMEFDMLNIFDWDIVFITTSYFSKQAIDFVSDRSNSNIVLIDGDKLTELMYEFGLGLQSKAETIEIKEIDNDYFDNL